MTKLRTITAIAVLAGSALVATAAVSAAPRSGSIRTLTFVSVQKSFTAVPPTSKASPPQIGDRMIFSDVLYNRAAQFGKPSGARIGSADNVCTIVSRAALQCTLVAHVPDGAFVATGSVASNSHTTDFAITGGVGAYAGTRGSARGTDVNQQKTVVVLHLTA